MHLAIQPRWFKLGIVTWQALLTQPKIQCYRVVPEIKPCGFCLIIGGQKLQLTLYKCFQSPRSKKIMQMLFEIQKFLNAVIEIKKFCRMYGSAVIMVQYCYSYSRHLVYITLISIKKSVPETETVLVINANVTPIQMEVKSFMSGNVFLLTQFLNTLYMSYSDIISPIKMEA